MAEHWNILQSQIYLLEVLEDGVLLAAAICAAISFPVCKWRVGLVDNSGGVVLRSSQDVTESANMAGLQAELLIGHKIGLVHLFDGLECAGTQAIYCE